MSDMHAWGRLRQQVSAWIDALTADESPPNVDTEYLRGVEYQYMTVGIDSEHGELSRCDLCGRLYDFEDTPALIDHVAGHDGQGQAEIDPFETAGMVEPAQEKSWQV